MSSIVNSAVNAAGDLLYTVISPSDNNGNSFRFPYATAPSNNIIKDIKDTARDVYVTKLSNDNKYYFHGNYNAAIAINNKNLITSKGGIYSLPKYKEIKKLNSGTVLANCVGWAHGRINEIWGTAVETGYVVHSGSEWVVPSRNNEVIECGAVPSIYTTPSCNAYAWYNAWPTQYAGWTKSGKFQDDKRPLPGAVMCWMNTTTDDGMCGHVAVVEAVYNYGQPNESVLISQSGYSLYGAEHVVWLQLLHRDEYANGTPYKFSNNYKFVGFLFSPVCQLLPSGAYYYTGAANYDGSPESITVLQADASVYSAINSALASAGKAVNKDIVVGQKVKICWFGSTAANEGTKLNLLDGTGIVVSVDKSAEYPYAVSLTDDGVVSGYFNRSALKVV